VAAGRVAGRRLRLTDEHGQRFDAVGTESARDAQYRQRQQAEGEERSPDVGRI